MTDIEKLRAERDTAWAELREIRTAISADPEESTADEVNGLVSRLATAELERDEARKTIMEHEGQVQCSMKIAAKWCSHNAHTDAGGGTLSFYWSRTIIALVERLTTAERQVEPLKQLVDRLDKIANESNLDSVFFIAANHHTPYVGPTYEKELEAAKRALADD